MDKGGGVVKKIKKLVTSISLIGAIVSFSIPAFAAAPIKGWMTEGTFTGYPYISWQEYGRTLAGTVAAEDRKSGRLLDSTNGYGTNEMYVRTPYGKLYAEPTYKGYYLTYYK